jgi:hypothetical protein
MLHPALTLSWMVSMQFLGICALDFLTFPLGERLDGFLCDPVYRRVVSAGFSEIINPNWKFTKIGSDKRDS